MSRSRRTKKTPAATSLPKCPTGIRGLDVITNGGLPRGRSTLVCGSAGCGKTLLGLEFLARGARDFAEPGVFISFEERATDLTANTASLGFDLPELIASQKLTIDRIVISRSEIVEAGEFNLDGLFIRLGAAIDEIGAKRVVLDTMEVLFSALPSPDILRAELHRLFEWLKDKGVTAIVTAERGERMLTRHGLEEYVSDCVIVLDQRVKDLITTRRVRIIKYRGSAHGTNEYPFVIGQHGFIVMPITEIALSYDASDTFVSTGVAKLDTMLGGRGVYQGSTTMVSGTAGTGKSSIAAQFVDAACRRGERCLYVALEESPSQICRNMRSIGIKLQPWVKRGLLHFSAARPTTYGLDAHINMMLESIEQFDPQIVVVDPVSALESAGSPLDVRAMVMRLIDLLKARHITGIFTSLSNGDHAFEHTTVGISSLVDSWLLVRNLEQGGERVRGFYIVKSRGMEHSKQVRELLLTDQGIDLADISIGPDGVVLVGSERERRFAQDAAKSRELDLVLQRKQAQLEQRGHALEAKIATLRAEFATDTDDIKAQIQQATTLQKELKAQRSQEQISRAKVKKTGRSTPGSRRKRG